MRRLIPTVIAAALFGWGIYAADTGAQVAPAPDLKAVILSPATPVGVRLDLTPLATNVGGAPTAGPITLTFATTVLEGPGEITLRLLGTGGYRVQSTTATSMTLTQTHVMRPGTSSALVVVMEWTTPAEPGAWMVWLHVSGGGDTNPANDAAAKRFTTP